MSGQVAIQRLADRSYRVRFRRHGRSVEWFFLSAREACDAAVGILLGSKP